MKRKCVLAAVLSFLVVCVYAQVNISGKVVSLETGRPVDGANIRVDHSLAGCSTNAKGEFMLRNLPAGEHVLRVTHVSYVPQSVLVKDGKTDVRIRLEDSHVNIGQVVVTRNGDSPPADGQSGAGIRNYG